VVKEILYDSFGKILNDTNPAMCVPLGFGFGLHDRDTGWVRMGWRDYDPETGLFTALDPIGYAGGDSDLYGYCVDDPVNWIDPEGLKSSVWDDLEDWYDEKIGEVERVFVWEASEGACEKCQALNGKEFRGYADIPERPHPNCKCRVRSCQDYPQYDDWETIEEKLVGYEVGIPYFWGALGSVIWTKVAKVREKRCVHIFRRCGGRGVKEIGTEWRHRTRNERENRTARAYKVCTGGDIEGGDRWWSTNPWTGQAHGWETNYGH
jgi:RHS repeat-associated protein